MEVKDVEDGNYSSSLSQLYFIYYGLSQIFTKISVNAVEF